MRRMWNLQISLSVFQQNERFGRKSRPRYSRERAAKRFLDDWGFNTGVAPVILLLLARSGVAPVILLLLAARALTALF